VIVILAVYTVMYKHKRTQVSPDAHIQIPHSEPPSTSTQGQIVPGYEQSCQQRFKPNIPYHTLSPLPQATLTGPYNTPQVVLAPIATQVGGQQHEFTCVPVTLEHEHSQIPGQTLPSGLQYPGYQETMEGVPSMSTIQQNPVQNNVYDHDLPASCTYPPQPMVYSEPNANVADISEHSKKKKKKKKKKKRKDLEKQQISHSPSPTEE